MKMPEKIEAINREEELVAKAKERFRQSWMYLAGYRWESLPPWQQKELIDAERERAEEDTHEHED